MERVAFFSDKDSLCAHLSQEIKQYTSVFILVDENTCEHCLPLMKSIFPDPVLIEIKSGEQNKNLSSCEQIWSALTDGMAERKSLLINLGGGVVTDMGGFAASCYKRGIDFINIPTTLLAMVDASAGGKTGIDFKGLKNQIGLFSEADEVLICPEFLKTLDARQIKSGLAEVIKHYLIADEKAFAGYKEGKIDLALIKRAVGIKSAIVSQDPMEKGIRKALNFGHTVGHALEAYFLDKSDSLLHGEAIAMGMAVETLIAEQKRLLTAEKALAVIDKLQSVFEFRPIHNDIKGQLIYLMLHDKKNQNAVIKMALIDDIGSNKIDIEVTEDEIANAIDKYNKMSAK